MVPRGQAASAAAHTGRPASTITTAGSRHSTVKDTRGAHAPVTTSSDWPGLHVRNAHPLEALPLSTCSAGPQKASATVSGTQAPSSGTSPSTHAHRPDESTTASRGQAAAQETPSQGAT
jgi:hypothetical protein